jgi:hypothetical protein
MATSLRQGAPGHICKLYVYSKDGTIIYEVGYATYCDFLHVQPVDHPTIIAMALHEKQFWHPDLYICLMARVTHI